MNDRCSDLPSFRIEATERPSSFNQFRAVDAPRERLVAYLDRERARILSLPFANAREYALLDIAGLINDGVRHDIMSPIDAARIRRDWTGRYCDILQFQIPARGRADLIALRKKWRGADARIQMEELTHATVQVALACLSRLRRMFHLSG